MSLQNDWFSKQMDWCPMDPKYYRKLRFPLRRAVCSLTCSISNEKTAIWKAPRLYVKAIHLLFFFFFLHLLVEKHLPKGQETPEILFGDGDTGKCHFGTFGYPAITSRWAPTRHPPITLLRQVEVSAHCLTGAGASGKLQYSTTSWLWHGILLPSSKIAKCGQLWPSPTLAGAWECE